MLHHGSVANGSISITISFLFCFFVFFAVANWKMMTMMMMVVMMMNGLLQTYIITECIKGLDSLGKCK